MRLEVRDDGPAFPPLLFGFDVHYAARHGEFGTEAPFVCSAEVAWKGLLDLDFDVFHVMGGKGLEEFRGVPSGEAEDA